MGRGGKAEGRGQARLDALPPPAAILAAVHAAMVLLVEPVGHAGRHGQMVHALAGLGVALLLGQVVAAGAAVAGLPGQRRRRRCGTRRRSRSRPRAAPGRRGGSPASGGSAHRRPAAIPAVRDGRAGPRRGARTGRDRRCGTGRRARRRHRPCRRTRRCSRPSGSASRLRHRPGPRSNGSSSRRDRWTSRPQGQTIRCRRRHRSCRSWDRP